MRNLPPDLQKQIDDIDAAFKQSMALPEGLCPGKLFRCQVADGYSVYQVLKVNKKTVQIVWRKDLTIDGWTDNILGEGGTFPLSPIESAIQREEGLRKLFSRKS